MNCYITFDYELCLGSRTGSVEGCLIEPMDAICSMLGQYNAKSNIFVDAAYLLRMNELKEKDVRVKKEYDLVMGNVDDLSSKGHSIQLHFHPQWINAQYTDHGWELDNDHYKLSDLPYYLQKEKLDEGLSILQSVSRNTIKAFRAGGFSFENFNELSSFFLEKGIVIDTSVLRGGVVNSKFQSYDYRIIPNCTSYTFSKSIKQFDENGAFKEYPISVMRISSIVYLYKKRVMRIVKERPYSSFVSSRWNDGLGIGASREGKASVYNRIKRLFTTSPLYASADGSLVYFLSDVFNYCRSNYEGDDFVIIGHPKIASPRTIAAFEHFINSHKEELSFCLF